MPRNSSGNYVLPAGNPVQPDTLIESEWANPTLSDIANAISDSLDRYGRGGMLAEFKVADGSIYAPGLSFTAQSTLGLYRAGVDILALASGGENVARFSNAAVELLKPVAITGNLGASGDVTVGGTLAVAGASTFTGEVTMLANASVAGAFAATSLTLASGLITAAGITGRIIPVGTIVMWSGTVANIPAGWRLCDGTNGTPDLRNRFLIGAVNDGGTTVTGGATKTGGSKDAVLPSHQHWVHVEGDTGGISADHTHNVNDPGHSHSTGSAGTSNPPPGAVLAGVAYGGAGGVAASTTGITLSGVTSNHSHHFAVGQATDWRGSDGTNQNLPPYYALAYIMCMG